MSYIMDKEGKLSKGTACGNMTGKNMPGGMSRSCILDSSTDASHTP